MASFSIGLYLRCVRETLGLTHQQVCELTKWSEICTIENLSYIENGKRHPSQHTLFLLLERLGKKEVFGDCYLQTDEYEVLVLEKELSLALGGFRYGEAEEILKKIEARLSTKYLTNRQYLAANHVILDLEFKRITPEEAIELFKKILKMTFSAFETDAFEKAFLTPWEAIIIFQIGNVYGDMGDYGKAVEILEKTYRNLLRYPDKFFYGEKVYANYMRAIIKWKGEMGKIEEAFEMGEHEIEKIFETGYAELLSGLLYARSYNTNEMLKREGITKEERSEINSGYEIAALVSEMFQEEGIADFIRRKIEAP